MLLQLGRVAINIHQQLTLLFKPLAPYRFKTQPATIKDSRTRGAASWAVRTTVSCVQVANTHSAVSEMSWLYRWPPRGAFSAF